MTDLKVSRTQLASEAGITANYITKIVLGERMPTPKILARFTRTLGEEFLCDWYWEISELDRASTDVSASVHLVIGDRAILKETYNRMVRECVEGNQKSTGNRNESGCRKDIDQLVRQYPEKYGVPLAGSPN
jgi:transcriptional regulator with XRE-family HTH domain